MITQIDSIIKGRLKTNWSRTPIKFKNERFEENISIPYIWPYISLSATRRTGLFYKNHSAVGFIKIAVLVPLFSGGGLIDSLTDELFDLMGIWSEGGLDCIKAIITPAPEDPEWHIENVVIDFNYQTCGD